MAGGLHLRLKTLVPDEDNPVAPTVSDIWPTADWHEREVYDMMGIRFDGHPDLRRILMWEGYPYFPLRKDFPLEGKTERGCRSGILRTWRHWLADRLSRLLPMAPRRSENPARAGWRRTPCATQFIAEP